MTSWIFLALAAAFAGGAACAWLYALSRIREAQARAETLERLGVHSQTLSEDLESRQKAIEQLVMPLAHQLEGYREETARLERTRLQDVGTVKAHLTQLTQQTQQIAGSLRSTHTRGRWGEITLRRAAELAGLSGHCDFSEQTGSDGGRLRPDMRVHLPGEREIVIDAKVPLDGYLQAVEADCDAARAAALSAHARHLKRHVDALASREYQAQLDESLDFVVLFLPHDALLGAACEQQRDLVEYALAKGVVFATPTTLFALLKTVAAGWREQQLTENAEQIVKLAGTMQDRLVTFATHFAKLGSALGKSVDSFNGALKSFETRLLPTSKRIREMGAAGKKELPDIEALDAPPREPAGPEPLP